MANNTIGRSLTLENYPYKSRRIPLVAARGVVATSEPLAAQAGLRILQAGGNAVDAAIAAAAALTVVEPTCNGIGGDAFGLIWDGQKLHGLNGSGRAPAAHTPGLYETLGHQHIPSRGWLAATVPGVPAAWGDMHARFGRLPLREIFAPAIEYARDGFPVAPMTALRWQAAAARFARSNVSDPALRPWRDTFTRDGRAPEPGDLWSIPDLGGTFVELAESGCESFYRGALAERFADFAAQTGGYITKADLAAHQSTWDDPICTSYRGHDVWEMPPNSQGIAALTALNILEGFDLAKYPRDSTQSYHLQLEAGKIAMSDAYRTVADPSASDVLVQERLDGRWADQWRSQIGDAALTPPHHDAEQSGTVYLCAADADGMMVSFIQSNFAGFMLGFGSGVVIPGTGIAVHSRGCGFTLEEGHPNQLAPGKRPFHTLAPSFLTREGRAIGPFGIMGGPIQPQAHAQFIVNELDYGMNPQTALDAPRFQWLNGKAVEVELAVPGEIMQGLLARGHQVRPCVEFAATPPQLRDGFIGSSALIASGDFGKAQMIRRGENGVYVAATDWRSDGCAVGF